MILVVPLCMLAAVLGMVIARSPIDIFVQIGLLVLVGLAEEKRDPHRRICPRLTAARRRTSRRGP